MGVTMTSCARCKQLEKALVDIRDIKFDGDIRGHSITEIQIMLEKRRKEIIENALQQTVK